MIKKSEINTTVILLLDNGIKMTLKCCGLSMLILILKHQVHMKMTAVPKTIQFPSKSIGPKLTAALQFGQKLQIGNQQIFLAKEKIIALWSNYQPDNTPASLFFCLVIHLPK